MRIIDMHCDTLLKAVMNEGSSLEKNDFHISFEKLKKGEYLAQFFACFAYLDYDMKPSDQVRTMIKKFNEDIGKSKIISQARNYDEIMKNLNDGKMSGILTIEEGQALEGNMDNLYEFYNKGVRAIGLTWNYPNSIGYPNLDEFINKGLTNFGKELVEEMNRLGIIIDVSHLSDGGFYDVAKLSNKPFVATHSNARYLKNVNRNLNDDMIKTIASSGGVIGVNYVFSFLGESDVARIDDIVKHMKYIKDIGGIDVCAIGSDFDGTKTPEFESAENVQLIVKALEQENFTYEEIEKITHKNVLRVVKEVCK